MTYAAAGRGVRGNGGALLLVDVDYFKQINDTLGHDMGDAVAGIGAGGPGGVISRTMVGLARSLEMESIAEGIETPEQLTFLEAAGCQVGQGYLFSKPLLTTADAISYLRATERHAVSGTQQTLTRTA